MSVFPSTKWPCFSITKPFQPAPLRHFHSPCTPIQQKQHTHIFSPFLFPSLSNKMKALHTLTARKPCSFRVPYCQQGESSLHLKIQQSFLWINQCLENIAFSNTFLYLTKWNKEGHHSAFINEEKNLFKRYLQQQQKKSKSKSLINSKC